MTQRVEGGGGGGGALGIWTLALAFAGLAAEAGMRLAGVLLLTLLGGCQADADALASGDHDSLAKAGLPAYRAGRARRGGARHRGGQQAAARPAVACAIWTGSACHQSRIRKEAHARLSTYAAQYNPAHAGPLSAG